MSPVMISHLRTVSCNTYDWLLAVKLLQCKKTLMETRIFYDVPDSQQNCYFFIRKLCFTNWKLFCFWIDAENLMDTGCARYTGVYSVAY
jgi:hypothetical protein